MMVMVMIMVMIMMNINIIILMMFAKYNTVEYAEEFLMQALKILSS